MLGVTGSTWLLTLTQGSSDGTIDSMPELMTPSGDWDSSSESSADDTDEWENLIDPTEMNEYYSSNGASEGESTVDQLPDLALDPFDNDNLDDNIEEITGHKLNLRKKKKTPYLQVRWTTGMTTWEPLRLIKKDVPVMAARYIITHKLGKYFHQDWEKRAVNRAAKVISKMRRAAGCSRSEMFGVQIPKTVEAALRMDQENGDNLWQEAIKKEMDALQELDTFKICPPTHWTSCNT